MEGMLKKKKKKTPASSHSNQSQDGSSNRPATCLLTYSSSADCLVSSTEKLLRGSTVQYSRRKKVQIQRVDSETFGFSLCEPIQTPAAKLMAFFLATFSGILWRVVHRHRCVGSLFLATSRQTLTRHAHRCCDLIYARRESTPVVTYDASVPGFEGAALACVSITF